MKKNLLLSLFVLICLTLSAYCFFNNNAESDKTHSALSTQHKNHDDSPAQADSPRNWLAYDFIIETKMLNGSNQPLSGSEFSGTIILKRLKKSKLWQGQVVEAKIENVNQDSTTNINAPQFPRQIPFTVEYSQFVFKNIDFLGLNTSHPIAALQHLLSQLSYNLDAPLVISTATADVSYQYELNHQKVTRKEQSRTPKQLDNAPEITQFDESWHLTLNRQEYPDKLVSEVDTHYVNPNGTFTVNQKLEVIGRVIESTLLTKIFNNASFAANQNSDLNFAPSTSDASVEIKSKKALQQALLKLSSLPDDALAKAIGMYLVENYSVDEMAQLINGANGHDNLASLIIYCIQKSSSFAAEVALVDLLDHPEMILENKQRIVISLGRFEAISELGFQQLVETSQAADKKLANLATLSIGTVSRFNREQHDRVHDFLSSAIHSEANNALTWLAINNSGSKDFNVKAAETLGTTTKTVDVALVKLLANDPNYHAKIVNFAMQSHNAKAINELTRAVAANKLTLTSEQADSIRQQIARTNNQLVKDQLSRLLKTTEKTW